MRNLKICYSNFWPEWPDEDFIKPILSKHYKVTMDQENPDVVFHSIFGGLEQTQKYNCKKIEFIGENRRPNPNSDFSISFDPHSETNFRLPLWQAYLLKTPELKDRLFGKKPKHKEFKRFCSFTVSNPSNITRAGVYNQLNQYKRVHSYGRYLTNDFILQKLSEGEYWRDAKDYFFRKYTHKFCLAYENNPHSYYCTEKLMDAFLAGAMPIYWGDLKVEEDWNIDAFINATKLPDVVTLIKTLDQNDIEFNRRYSEPIFTEEQRKKHLDNLENFEEWLVAKIDKS